LYSWVFLACWTWYKGCWLWVARGCCERMLCCSEETCLWIALMFSCRCCGSLTQPTWISTKLHTVRLFVVGFCCCWLLPARQYCFLFVKNGQIWSWVFEICSLPIVLSDLISRSRFLWRVMWIRSWAAHD
jgi:hypothetical protein